MIRTENYHLVNSKSPLPEDRDKMVDRARIAATHLDHGKEFFSLGVESVVLIDSAIYSTELSEFAYFLHIIGKAVLTPFLYLTLFLAPVLIGTNSAQHETTNKIYHKLQQGSLKDRVSYLQSSFYQLSPSEKEKISAHVQKHFSHLSPEKQSAELAQIEEAGVKVKMATLTRRLSPGMGPLLSQELSKVVKELESSDPLVQKKGGKRAEILFSSVSKQLKQQMRIHKISVLSAAAPLTYIVFSFLGIASLPLAILLNGIGVLGIFGEIAYHKMVFHHGKGEYAEQISQLDNSTLSKVPI